MSGAGKQHDECNSRTEIPAEWLAEFEAARKRPLPQRFRYAFIKTYKPVLDDAPYRSFDTMEEYRQWCEDNLPDWLEGAETICTTDQLGSAHNNANSSSPAAADQWTVMRLAG